MFAFDAGGPARKYAAPYYDDWHGDDGLSVHYRDPIIADRHARQAVARLRACTDIAALREEWTRSGMICDGLWMGGHVVQAEDVAHAYQGRLDALCPNLREEVGSAAPDGANGNEPLEQYAMFNFESGGSQGPWLVWTDQGTKDRIIPPQSFYLREEAGKTKLDLTQFIMDIHSLRKGWQEGDGVKGVAPKWTLGQTLDEMPPHPNKEAKRGFSVRVAISKSQAASWEQAGYVPWSAMGHLAPQLNAGPVTDKSKLPLIKIDGTLELTTSRGVFFAPKLEVVKWLDRPEILPLDGALSFDAGEPEAKPQPAPAPAAAPAMADDDFGDFG